MPVPIVTIRAELEERLAGSTQAAKVRGTADLPSYFRRSSGPGWALAYHSTYELFGRDAVLGIPGGEAWLAVVDR